MKRILLSLGVVFLMSLSAQAQKFAMVDMEYIMGNIPAYERASEQLNQISRKWQAEVETLDQEAKNLYKNYQNEGVFLSEQQKKDREQAIVDKEKEASELKKKYFGPQGELFKKRTALLEPIQEEVYNAIKAIASSKGFQLVMDRSDNPAVIFASPSIDISNDVLSKLGYAQ